VTLPAQVRRVGHLVWTERRPYLTGSIFVALSTLTSLAYPYVVRLIIDDAIGGGQIQRLNQLCLIMVGILLLEAGATWGRDYFFAWGAERVGVSVRRLVFETLLRQDIEWVEDLLSYDRIKRQGYFDPDVVEHLKRQYRAPGYEVHPHLGDDLLLTVLTFGLLLDAFALPDNA